MESIFLVLTEVMAMLDGLVLIKILVVVTILAGSLTIFANLAPHKAGAETFRFTWWHGGTKQVMEPKKSEKIRKSEAEWRELLSARQYEVSRCGGTEPPFTGQYHDHHEAGLYTCICCGSQLFSSKQKFASGSGWPSYWQPVAPAAVVEIKDISYGMIRTEVICARCEAHLGHVFDDGPQPTGLRYCINSASLNFVKAD